MNQAEACDKILKHLLANPNKEFTNRKIMNDLFQGNSLDAINHIISEIKKINPRIVKIIDFGEGSIMSNGLTEQFINNGGFVKMQSEKEYASKLQHEKLVLEVEDLRNKFFDYAKTKKQVNRNEIILWIGIGLTVIGLIISLLKK